MGIYDNWKYRKNFDKYGTRRIADAIQTSVADDVSAKLNKGALKYNYNEALFSKGCEWFESGLSLEDAPEEMKKNVSFVAGFDRGKRISSINQQLYDLGREYFEKGISLEEAPENYRNNEYFIAGYNDTINKGRNK